VTASAPRAELDEHVRNVWLLVGGLGAAGVGLATALAGLRARRLVRPLDAVAQTSRELGNGDFSARAERSGVPEIDAVAQALNASGARIAEMVAREREFASNVSHQLRTPLTALRLRLEEVADLDDREARAAEAELALAEADRLEATISALLRHARSGDRTDTGDLDVDGLVGQHVKRWEPVFQREERVLRVEAGAGAARARSSPAVAGQVLDVLLENALRHGRGEVAVSTGADERHVWLAVEDQGPGIPESGRDIFERGISNAHSSGIGLHLAHTLAQAHGGHLALARHRPPRFELRLHRSD
jgi:signal transduction histidine kinase